MVRLVIAGLFVAGLALGMTGCEGGDKSAPEGPVDQSTETAAASGFAGRRAGRQASWERSGLRLADAPEVHHEQAAFSACS